MRDGSTPRCCSTCVGGELGDGDDGVAVFGGLAGLFGEARAEVGGGVVSGHDEQIVEGGDGAARRGVDALVEGVEQVGARGACQASGGWRSTAACRRTI